MKRAPPTLERPRDQINQRLNARVPLVPPEILEPIGTVPDSTNRSGASSVQRTVCWPQCAMTSRSRSSLGVDFTVPRLLYCAFGCVLGGAVLDGAALGFALAFAFVFFFGVVVVNLGVILPSDNFVQRRNQGRRRRSRRLRVSPFLAAASSLSLLSWVSRCVSELR